MQDRVWVRLFGVLFLFSHICSLRAEDARACVAAMADAGASKKPKPLFIVDTSAVLADPLFGELRDDDFVIPGAVLEELDHQKSDPTREISATAREASRFIADHLAPAKSNHVPLEGGGSMTLYMLGKFDFEAHNLDRTKADHQIIATALLFQRANPDRRIVVLTHDNNLTSAAIGVGLEAERLEVKVDPAAVKEVFDGPIVLRVSNEHFVKVLRWKESILPNQLHEIGLSTSALFHENQFLILEPETPLEDFDLKTEMRRVWRFVINGSKTPHFETPKYDLLSKLPIQPRNLEQIMAMDLLMDSRVKLVSLTGMAGSGKTLLVMMAALAQSSLYMEDKAFYESVLITRPNVVTGADIGFLPGSLEEKMLPFEGPFRDALEVVVSAARKFHSKRPSEGLANLPFGARGHRGRFPEDMEEEVLAGRIGKLTFGDFINGGKPKKEIVESLLREDFLRFQAIAYSRGRSWLNTLLVIDEAQNLTLHEARTMVTRAAEGTKIILLGDPDQIDVRGLTRTSNGLVIAASRFKGSHLAAHVHLVKGERSELATEAVRRLR